MKFSTQAFLALFAFGAHSFVIDVRDIASIKSAIINVQGSVDNLTAAVKALDSDVRPVANVSNKLIKDIVNGIHTVGRSKQISTSEALGLLNPIKVLQTSGQNLLGALKAKIETVEMAKSCDIARVHLSMISDNGKTLIDTIVSKVPDVAQGIAQQQANQTSKIF